MFLNYKFTPFLFICVYLNRKHEMFLNLACFCVSAFNDKLNRKHEMFLNETSLKMLKGVHPLNRKHEMFLNFYKRS